jgi:hypothetical protein
MHNSLKITWSVTTVAIATVVTDKTWKIQPTQRHTVTGGCMCRIRRLLMMGARVPETCYNDFKTIVHLVGFLFIVDITMNFAPS